ncbi:MAG: hypothetical protein IT372_06005, partial [Polyangiaceae bacterium]|nr:hypothetical protein [Polyangiaceae bacterium]
MLRRSFLAAALLLPGCALPGGDDRLTRPMRQLAKAIGALDDARLALRADRQAEIARLVARLRLALDQLEHAAGCLEDRLPDELAERAGALAAATLRLQEAAVPGQEDRLRPQIHALAGQADALAAAVRAAVSRVRPSLRRADPPDDRLVGRAPTGGAVTAVRIAGAAYALGALRGLAGALTAPDPPARSRRAFSSAAYAALLALGVAAATAGARPIAALGSREISMPAG